MRSWSLQQTCTASYGLLRNTTTTTTTTSIRPIPSRFARISRAGASAFRMASTGAPVTPGLDIETKDIQTAAGVSLNANQKTVVGSVLDLFAGRPSLQKLALWRDDATFTDPLTIAQGRDHYAAQWYGLQSMCSKIEPLHHSVTDAGNPILMDLKTKYVIKGIGKQQTIESVVAIHLDERGKIAKLEDKWNGKLPDGPVLNVSSMFQLLSPFWWVDYWIRWAFWGWSWTWETRVWRAFRHLNAVTVPKFISVPKNAEEDAKKGN